MNIRWRGLLALAVVLLVIAGGALRVSANSAGISKGTQPVSMVHAVESGAHSFARLVGLEGDESQVAPGTLDDGKDLLPQAKISIEQAIAAAQSSASEDIGEIDLEHYQGHLVFNVDVGDHDVKVDATTGQVLGSGTD
jgi:uncharacterized membrane protein YkoI